MRVLLVSTYELGHQPLHLATPAAALRRAGHEVRTVDLHERPWGAADDASLGWAELLAVSVPMHTAMRLAVPLLRRARERQPDLVVCLYGLYATLADSADLAGVADVALAGEYLDGLVELAAGSARSQVRAPGGSSHGGSSHGGSSPPTPPSGALSTAASSSDAGGSGRPASEPAVRVELGRRRPGLVPDRQGLANLGAYARLSTRDGEHLAGYVEATTGCAERCRHCPVPVVYAGRVRRVPVDDVVADVESLVALGARHVTFGDPDFLNVPRHAERVVDAVHGAFPEVTFDVTAKVTHLLRHDDLVARWAHQGLAFVVSALETTDDAVLALLGKGHTRADASRAVDLLAGHGVTVRPSWLPFTPWTTAASVVDLLRFTAAHGLVPATDPVQYSIRLLVPPGSLLLELPEARRRLDGYDPNRLSWTWSAADHRLDALQSRLAARAEEAGRAASGPAEVWPEICDLVADALDEPAVRELRSAGAAGVPAPGLTEPWFCCAEPTEGQLGCVAGQPA